MQFGYFAHFVLVIFLSIMHSGFSEEFKCSVEVSMFSIIISLEKSVMSSRQIFHARVQIMIEDVYLLAPCAMESRPAGTDQMKIQTSAYPGSVVRTSSSVRTICNVLRRKICA